MFKDKCSRSDCRFWHEAASGKFPFLDHRTRSPSLSIKEGIPIQKIKRSQLTHKKKIGKRNKKKISDKVFKIFGTNANGVLGKKESLISNILQFQPAAFFVQETKVSRKGQLKIENYEIFEVVRLNCPTGGSILTGIHKNLNPVFISGGRKILSFW